MFDGVCLLNNKVFVFLPDAFLVAFEYIKNGNTLQTFKERAKLTIPLSKDFHIKEIFLDVVENYSVGLKCLSIVGVSTTNDISLFMYSETLSNNIFSFKKTKILNKPNTEPGVNLFMTHGPTFVYFHKSLLEIYSVAHGTQHYLDLVPVFDGTNDSFKVLQVTAIGELQDPDSVNVLLIIISRETTEGIEVCLLSINVDTKLNNSPINHKKLPTSYFYPRCFQNAIKSITVTNIKIALNTVKWKENSCCIVTNEECMVFSNGILKFVARLPFCDVLHLRTDLCDFKTGNVNLMLVCDNEDVHLLTNAGTSELQLTKTWPSVKSVLCGDVLLNGSKQLLLLKDTSFYSWQDSCIISDLSSDNPVDILCQAQDSDVSMSRAIPGLLAKVQKGKAMIAEAEYKVSTKIEATLDALIRLKYCGENEVMEHHVSSFQESLVDIILHNDENSRTHKDVSLHSKALKVLNHWIKLIDNRCVICWTIMNTDEKSIFNPTLITMIPNQQIQSTQKLFIHKCDSFAINDECRREINPGDKFSVLMSLEVPEFNARDIEVAVILSWYKATSSEFENEMYLPMQDKTLNLHQMILKTVVSAEHVFKAQLEDISSLEHLACMKVVQQRIVLQVFTLHADVTQFENLLLTTAYGAAHLLLIENSEIKCLVFKSANLPLFGVHMTFNSLSPKTLEIEAFTKDDKESSLLVQFLYQQLPEDTLILPQGSTLSEFYEHQHQALYAMKEEVDLLLSTISIYNVTEKIGPGKLRSPNEAGTVVIPKETFLRVRKALVKKECTTDNVVRQLTCARFSNDKLVDGD